MLGSKIKSRSLSPLKILVPMAGLEPARTLSDQRILSPLRLPFRHIGVRQQASVLRSAFLQAQNGYFQKQSEYQSQYRQLLLDLFGHRFRHWLRTIGFDPA